MAKPYDLDFNHNAIPDLAFGFACSTYAIGTVTAFARDGMDAVNDQMFPRHTLIFHWDRTRLVCTEETLDGLKQNSIEKYRDKRNRIIAVLYWTGWDDPARRNAALDRLAYIRSKQGDRTTKLGKYNFRGLLTKIKYFGPLLTRLGIAKADPLADWCTENDMSLLKNYGQCPWMQGVETTLAPDEAYLLMKDQKDVRRILNYYQYPKGV